MHLFVVSRYLFFALFTALNVVLATVAAWNSQYGGSTTGIDTFLIIIAILGILLVFPIVFIEVVRKGAFTSRVWFEVTWTAIFWLLNLSGAAATSAVQPRGACSALVVPALAVSCDSSKVVLAFTWLSTVTLLTYFVALLIVAVLHMSDNPRIWQAAVNDVAWFEGAPRKITSPVLPIYAQHATVTKGPVPLYTVSVQPARLVTRVPVPSEKPANDLIVSTSVNLSPPAPRTLSSNKSSQDDTPPLYPTFVTPLVQNKPTVQPPGPEPLPAGQWPRPAPKRQQSISASAPSSPSSAGSFASSSASLPAPAQPNPRTGLKPLTLQATRERAGPMRQTQSAGARTKSRPPPLDLSSISAFNSNKSRQDRAPRR